MMRTEALDAVGGFRDDFIAGEEPELCVRLRAAGWRIWRLDADMAMHDAAMTRFGQWWRRAARAGYAFAQGASLHGAPPERHLCGRCAAPGFGAFGCRLCCMTGGAAIRPLGLGRLADLPASNPAPDAYATAGSLSERATLALFQMLARFAEAWGQIKFLRDRLLGRQARLIEYK